MCRLQGEESTGSRKSDQRSHSYEVTTTNTGEKMSDLCMLYLSSNASDTGAELAAIHDQNSGKTAHQSAWLEEG